MFTLKRFVAGSLFVFVLAGTALAQKNRAPINNPQEAVTAAPLVKATATAKRVRFVSPGTVVQLRLEVYNEAGQKLFDTELNGGNVLDWYLQDGAGQDLQAGSYACVVTIKSLSGRLSQRVGLVTVNEKKAAIEAAEGAQLSVAQQQTIGPVEGNAALTILQESDAEAITAVTHDGAEGQLTSTKGALTFRTGDIFSGKDKEQMRLTEEGNLGIGTTKPQTRLDVAGKIRAREGFQFSDGSTLKINDEGALTHASATGTEFVNATGTGTTNQITKWTDGPNGVLGDSAIAESGGNVAIGGPVLPSVNFDYRKSNPTGDVLQRIWNEFPDLTARPLAGAKLRYVAAVGGTSQLQLTDNAEFLMSIAGNNSIGMQFRVRNTTDPNSEAGLNAAARMTILRNGNVGIGTTGPAARLHVAGASSSTATPIAIVESSGVQMPISFRREGTEHARIRANSAGDLVFATVNGSDKDIFFRAGDDSSTDMFIQSSTGKVGIGTTSPDANAKLDVNNGAILSSGSAGGRLSANNPNNQSASVHLDWFNDTARIRYGGTGAGAANGLVIQGQGDATKVTITNNGDLIAGGNLFGNRIFLQTLDLIDSGGPPTDLCARQIGSGDNAHLQLTNCSSSIRYKTDVAGYTPGLDLISRLRPVSFRWKGSGTADLGFVAEEVAEAEPLLATTNERGEIEGVKYDRIGVVLINAVREQQAQIKTQQQQLSAKDERIAKLAARLARYESNLARYEVRLASLERTAAGGKEVSVTKDKRTKRQFTARVNSSRKRGPRRHSRS